MFITDLRRSRPITEVPRRSWLLASSETTQRKFLSGASRRLPLFAECQRLIRRRCGWLQRQVILLRRRGSRRASERLFRHRFHNGGRVCGGEVHSLLAQARALLCDRSALPLNRRNGECTEHGENCQSRGERTPLCGGPETPLLFH